VNPAAVPGTHLLQWHERGYFVVQFGRSAHPQCVHCRQCNGHVVDADRLSLWPGRQIQCARPVSVEAASTRAGVQDERRRRAIDLGVEQDVVEA
jgi:hypothetical protein